MGDIARCSLGKPGEFYSEELLYQMFGVNAELLIDHAWGYEPCTIAQIRAYKPQSSSLGCGQVLHCPYTADKARIVVQEMIDGISLELVEKRLVTDQLVLTVGYDIENLTRPEIRKVYKGPVTTDRYGRRVPKHAHGTWNLSRATSSSSELLEAMAALYDKIVNPALLIRRMEAFRRLRVHLPQLLQKRADALPGQLGLELPADSAAGVAAGEGPALHHRIQPQPGAAHQDGPLSPPQNVVHNGDGRLGVPGGGPLLRRVRHGDHVMGDPLHLRRRGGGGADGHAPVDLHGVHGHHLAVQLPGQGHGHFRFSAGGGSYHAQNGHRRLLSRAVTPA